MRGSRASFGFVVLVALSVGATLASCAPEAPAPVTQPPEPADAVPWPDLTWTEAEIAPPLEILPGPSEHLAAVAAGDAGFVAVGFVEIVGRRDGLLLHSPDGAAWARVGLPAALRDVDLVDVAAGPGGYVAVGSELPPDGTAVAAVVLWSPDGRDWQRGILPDGAGTYVAAVAGGPAGYVVAGDAAEQGAAAWRSGDGRAWERVAAADLGGAVAGLTAPVEDGDGWAALTWNAGTPGFLRSADGTDWVATAIERDSEADAFGLAAGRWGYVAQGTEGDCGPLSSCPAAVLAWWSGDGTRWTRLPPTDALTSGGSVVVGAGDHGLVSLDGLSAWASTTGWGWTPLPEPGDGSAVVNAAAVAGDVIVAVGERYREDGRSDAHIVVARPVE